MDPVPFFADRQDRNAFDPQAFERAVAAAATPVSIQFKSHLLRFISRHAPAAKVIVGMYDGYDWSTGVLTLTAETVKGDGMRSLLTVAHEIAHFHQHQELPWVPAWVFKLPLVRMWFERDAWNRALMMLT